MIKKSIKSTLLAGAIILAGLYAGDIHKSWLRNKVADNVVRITAGPDYPSGGGTGFVLETPSGQKVTVTNRHVCNLFIENNIDIYSSTSDGKHSKLNLIQIYEHHDLCILSPVPGLDGLSLGGPIGNGDSINVVGHPYLWDVTMTSGEVSGYEYVQLEGEFDQKKQECKYGGYLHPMYQVCVNEFESIVGPIITAPGNSGSPVVNGRGNVVGVLFAGNGSYSIIVPFEYLNDLLKGY